MFSCVQFYKNFDYLIAGLGSFNIISLIIYEIYIEIFILTRKSDILSKSFEIHTQDQGPFFCSGQI